MFRGEQKRKIPFGMRTSTDLHSEEKIQNIRKLANVLKAVGEKHGVTAAQVALAWILAQGKDIIPLPGTRRIKVFQLFLP